jgi:hypothetical protein
MVKLAVSFAASLLADLHEALTGTKKSALANHQAQKLKDGHPTLRKLTSALRKQGSSKKSMGGRLPTLAGSSIDLPCAI